MTGNSMAAAILSYHFDRRPRLEPGEKCAAKGCAMHGGPRYTTRDGHRVCARCWDRLSLHLYVPGEQPEVTLVPRHGIATGGNRRGNPKLTQEQADEIRERVAGGEMRKALAEEFGITRQTVTEILAGRTY